MGCLLPYFTFSIFKLYYADIFQVAASLGQIIAAYTSRSPPFHCRTATTPLSLPPAILFIFKPSQVRGDNNLLRRCVVCITLGCMKERFCGIDWRRAPLWRCEQEAIISRRYSRESRLTLLAMTLRNYCTQSISMPQKWCQNARTTDE